MAISKNIIIAVIALAVIMAEVEVTTAVNCDIAQLAPCLPVIQNPNLDPTPTCCAVVKEQVPCFCDYLRDPHLAPYVNSPGAKKITSFCGVSYPKCN